jgi:ribonucleotide monophosphatase NagD (HAD superfamily)
MIGDNPKTDISGGNAKGMTTILVKTGVFQTDASTSKNGNDSVDPATHVVTDFNEAIDLIFRLENL